MIGNLQGFLIWMFGSIPLQKRAERQVPPWVGRNFKLTYPRMRGDDISAWQDQAGGVVVNGWYEEQDVERCKQIQKNNGLVPDGIVGPQTWYATFSKKGE